MKNIKAARRWKNSKAALTISLMALAMAGAWIVGQGYGKLSIRHSTMARAAGVETMPPNAGAGDFFAATW